jgi:hypothetical protein
MPKAPRSTRRMPVISTGMLARARSILTSEAG